MSRFGVGGWRRVWMWAGVPALLVASIGSAPAGRADAAAEYMPLAAPERLVDTRPGATTVDGQFAGIGLRAAGSTLEVDVAGRAGVPLDAPAVVLTVAAVDAVDAGFLTVFPTGAAQPNASNVNYYEALNTANTVVAKVGDGGKVSIFNSAATHLIVDVSGYLPAGTYSPLAAPARLADTRPGGVTVDGQLAGIGLLAAGSTLEVPVAGRAGVPGGATVVVLTVTAVDPSGVGFLTVHPTGTALPNASNVNFDAGLNKANTVVAKIGDGGKVSIFTSAATHLIVDVSGDLPAGSYVPLSAPARLADTRTGGVTIDGSHAGIGALLGGHAMQLPVAGRGGLPADASAAVLTITAVGPRGNGFATAHANGTIRPNASNLNYVAARDVANTVIARVGAGGEVCIFTSATTHVVVDVSGYFTGPPPPAAGPACPDPQPLVVWPATDVVLTDPEVMAAIFVEEVFGVTPLVSFFSFDDVIGEVAVNSPGDDEDPATEFRAGSLVVHRYGPEGAWFVIAGVSERAWITSPPFRSTIAPGPVKVEGLAGGFESTVFVEAFLPGDHDAQLDSKITMSAWTIAPFSTTLDLSSAPPGGTVVLRAVTDTGLSDSVSDFSVIPVRVAS